MFLDDSARATSPRLNLMKFRRDDGTFDFTRGSAPPARVFITAQEILVDHGSLPDRARSPLTATSSARWAWASPTSVP